MAKYLTLDDVAVKDKVVLVRVDFNSAVDPETKKVLDETRIRAHGETTIKELTGKGAKVVVLAHQGRKGDPDFIPLKQHAEILGKVLGKPVKYIDDVFGEKAQKAIKELKSGEILVLENVRSFPGETKEGTPEEHARTELVKAIAPLAGLFVNDAFAAAHRAHVSMVGFTAVLPSVAGRIMERELKSLSKVLENPEKAFQVKIIRDQVISVQSALLRIRIFLFGFMLMVGMMVLLGIINSVVNSLRRPKPDMRRH